jgi:hypothetical protein
MLPGKKPRRKIRISKVEKDIIAKAPAGLAKSHRIIRTEKDKEIQFMKLCTQIRINDFKKARSERQREERIAKRHAA